METESELKGKFSMDGGKSFLLTETCFDKLQKSKGRPKRKLNEVGLEVVEKLASFMCTEEEIAAFMGVSVELLHNDANLEIFTECVKKGQKKGKASLRSHQFRLARTNATMAIWLGKQYLGQRDDLSEGGGDGAGKAVVEFVFKDCALKDEGNGE